VAGADEVARAWLDAYNQGDAERLTELSEPDLVMHGLAGEQYGPQALRERMAAATYGVSVQVRVLRDWTEGDAVVLQTVSEVFQPGAAVATQEVAGAATFTVRDGRVARVRVGEDLTEALRNAGVED
jgi:ketosteroid isomerase-like protein